MPNKLSFWRIIDSEDGYIILPDGLLFCPFCKSPMLLHNFHASQAHEGFYHCDVRMKCPFCSFLAIFGVPVDKEGFKRLKTSKLHGKVLRHEVVALCNEGWAKIIEERLKSLGYW